MTLHNIHQAKSQLSKLIEQAEQGEEVIIAKAGKPVAKLISFQLNEGKHKSGQWQGLKEISSDSNDLEALEEKLEQSQKLTGNSLLEIDLLAIGKRNAKRKILDARNADEILGYDNEGLLNN